MSILGHHRQLEYLNKVLKRERLAHAYLFYGPEHVGKFTVAKTLAKSFYCQNYRGSTSIDSVCDACGQCRLVDQNAHPSVTIIDPEISQKDISIAEMRALKRSFSLGIAGRKWRVAIVNHAERMTPEATNAFLKLLEEPGAQTLFILIAQNRESLFPTIVSRAAPIRFSLIADSVLREFVKARIKSQLQVKDIVAQSFGQPGIALQYIEDNEVFIRDQKIAKSVALALAKSDIPLLLRIAERASSENDIRAKVIVSVFRALREDLVAGKRHPEVIKKCSRIASVLETTNVNPRLALDALLLTTI